MIKLIVTDMDGTLVDSNHKINDELWEILPKLKAMGIIFSVASGRQYNNLVSRFKGHENEMVFIAENGAIGITKGEELFSDTLNKEIVLECIKLGRKIESSATILSGKKGAYIESKCEEAYKEASIGVNNLKLVEDLTKVEDDILKIAVYHGESSHDFLYEHYKGFETNHTVVVSGKKWLDVMNKGVNKGSALKKVQNYLNITKEETMVFGDYLNDLEMFANAEFAIVMKNGHEELKKIATHIAKSNDENGVVEAIKEYVLK